MSIKVIIGIVIIIASFGYILKNHDQSMMQHLMKKQKEKMDEEALKLENAETKEDSPSEIQE